MSRLKVGDIVRISPESKYYLDNDIANPKNMDGTISYICDDNLGYQVLWNNNIINSYNETDLVLVNNKSIINLKNMVDTLKMENDKLREDVEKLEKKVKEKFAE